MLGIVPVPRRETVVKKLNEARTTLANRETLKLVASVLLKMHQYANNLRKGLMIVVQRWIVVQKLYQKGNLI